MIVGRSVALRPSARLGPGAAACAIVLRFGAGIATPRAQRVATGLPSLAAAGGGQAGGAVDIAFLGRGNAQVVVGFGGHPDAREELGPVGDDFGHLYQLPASGRWRKTTGVAAHELSDPDGAGVDSNPYSVLAQPGRQVVADAGGNALVEVRRFPFPVGGANVYRVPRDGGDPEAVADGFTNIIDLAFGHDGSLHVLEFAKNGLLAGPQGRLTRIAPDGTRTVLVDADLLAPGGIAIGSDGAIYLTRHTTLAGAGQVVRVTFP